MKKKIGIALVLAVVMVVSLCAPVLADEPIELQSSDGGTAEWTDDEAAVDDYSIRLDWPAPYRDADNNYIVPRASVAITDLADLTISEVNSWSYWANAPEDYCPNLTFYTDTVGDGNSDTTITAWPKNDPPNADVWTQIDETTIGGYQGAYVVWGNNPYPSWKFDWAAVQSSYGDAGILNLLIGKGVIGTNQDITAYIDDFTLNGIVYSFEPAPVVVAPKHKNHYITIRLPDASLKVKRSGTAWYGDVDFNDGTWRIQIPAGVRIWSDKGGPAHKVVVDENGNIMPGVWFMRGEPIVTRM